jgi:hypothetical protein
VSSWQEFVPYREQYKQAVWIEIDRARMNSDYRSGPDLLKQWKVDGQGRKLMPRIESAYLGPVPRAAFKRAILVREEQLEFLSIGC